MRDEDQTHMHPSQPLSPTITQWLRKHHTVHTSTLANFNLHQPLISFLYMIPSCEQYSKDYKRDAKYEITLTLNLITKTIYYYK